jgi:predicted nucleic acid-binding protein
MPVVSNTSPVLNLAIIGQLGVLRQQLGEVWIPPAVRDELRPDEERPGSAAIREALEAGWLRVVPVTDRPLVEALALQCGADPLLLDERDARRVARAYGLNLTGVLGILLRAQREGQLASLPEAVDALRDQAGFRLAPDMVARILAAADRDP